MHDIGSNDAAAARSRWCVRMLAAKQPAGAHAPEWCARDVALGKVPAFDLDPPPMVMIIGSKNILWEDLLIMHSPFWTLIHQYLLRPCNTVLYVIRTLQFAAVFACSYDTIRHISLLFICCPEQVLERH